MVAKRDRALTELDLTNIDLTNFDVAAMFDSDLGRLARTTLGMAAGAVRETTYVGVGFTVLGIQRLQVRRRDLERALRR
ncbi:MAG: hypothetical protein ABWZ99_03855 [Ilumatobacteraceae bacterium]